MIEYKFLFFRLERQLSRAEKRHTKIGGKIEISTDDGQTSGVPRFTASPSPSSTLTSADLNELTSERLTSGSDLTDDMTGLGSNLAGNLKNICYAKSPVMLQSSPSPAAPSPSNSDSNTVSFEDFPKINKCNFEKLMGPIIYFFDGRSPSRHKQNFFFEGALMEHFLEGIAPLSNIGT